MSKELLIAIYENDITRVEKELSNGADINYVPTKTEVQELRKIFGTKFFMSAFYQAGMKKSLNMLKFLYNYQFRDKGQKINVDYIPYAHCDSLLGLIVGTPPHNSIDLEIIGFLLSINSSFHVLNEMEEDIFVILHRYNANNEKLLTMFLLEAIYRGDFAAYKAITSNLKIAINLDAQKLKEYLLQYPRRQPTFQQQTLFASTLAQLVMLKKITQDDLVKMTAVVNDSALYAGAQGKNLQCLKPYLANKEKVIPESLESIIAELQYQLGNLKEPGTNETLANYNIEYDPETLRVRKSQYSIKKLAEFVDKENISRMKAVVHLHTKPSVLAAICKAAIHKDLSARVKDDCLSLLYEYENIPTNELSTIYTSIIATDTIIQHQNDVAKKAAEGVVEALTKRIDEQKKEIKSLHAKIDQLIDVLKNEKRPQPEGPGMWKT